MSIIGYRQVARGLNCGNALCYVEVDQTVYLIFWAGILVGNGVDRITSCLIWDSITSWAGILVDSGVCVEVDNGAI